MIMAEWMIASVELRVYRAKKYDDEHIVSKFPLLPNDYQNTGILTRHFVFYL